MEASLLRYLRSDLKERHLVLTRRLAKVCLRLCRRMSSSFARLTAAFYTPCGDETGLIEGRFTFGGVPGRRWRKARG